MSSSSAKSEPRPELGKINDDIAVVMTSPNLYPPSVDPHLHLPLSSPLFSTLAHQFVSEAHQADDLSSEPPAVNCTPASLNGFSSFSAHLPIHNACC